MSRLTIEANFSAGIKLIDACTEAITLATKLGVNVSFDFNDVTVIARPNIYPIALAEEYRRVVREEEIKIATII